MADPKKSLYRIWRDTRFSADKRPLKTNVAAVFPHRGGDRHTSAGLYLEISPEWVFAGGGLYMPDPQGLHRIRERIAEDPKGFRARRQRPGAEEGGRAAGRVAQASAARLSRRSPRRRLPEDEAVPGLGRVAARAGHDAEVLDGAADDVPRDGAAAGLPERRAGCGDYAGTGVVLDVPRFARPRYVRHFRRAAAAARRRPAARAR